MAKYYCNCNKGKYVIKKMCSSTSMYLTEVDDEGICTYCGHYAFARANESHEIYPRSNKKVTELDPLVHASKWGEAGMLDKYWWYYHGHGGKLQGLNSATLKKDQESIKNERETRAKFKRASGSSS